jgi:23S rRNA pseudouridine955/2504/2580 synthase
MAIVETITVAPDEGGLRLDRWFKQHYPGLAFGQLSKLCRTGQVRLDGKRVDPADKVGVGQVVRVPPLAADFKGEAEPVRKAPEPTNEDARFIRSITIFEDDDVMVLNKPAGLAVQGGSGITRHIDKMLEALVDRKGNVPRLVHRIDRETSGCLLIAKRRSMAAELTASFRSRSARKIYWALVAGVPKPHQGKISTFLARDENEDRMKIAQHGEEGASHALTYYNVIETAGPKLAWLSLKPVTGRTHQLRAHCAHIGHPIIGDPKYFIKKDWELPGGVQNRLHLLARRIQIPHPRGTGIIDVTAPLPQHMRQSWNLIGLDADDPTADAYRGEED